MYDSRRELVKALRAGPTVVRGLCRGLTDDDARRRPAPEEWAVVEVVAHLADSDERARQRVERMLTEDNPHLPGYDPAELAREERYIDRELTAELKRFEALRAQHVALLESLDDAGWQRPGVHGEEGPMTVELYEHHTAGEDPDHMAQIARMLP